jgi:hypothetical protein
LLYNDSNDLTVESFMGHIFISYSRTDTEYAHGLADVLQSKGLDVWIDARLDYGSQWPLELQKQLDSCAAFIVIMTPRSFASEWVQSELQRARRKLKPIFPLLLEGDEPWLSVESTQFYDVRGGKLPDARFYSALQRVKAAGETASTLQAPKPSTEEKTSVSSSFPRLGVRVLIALIALAAVAFAACAILAAGPLLGGLLNISARATPEASTPNVGLRQTAAPTLPPVATFTPLPTESLPTATERPDPTAIPPTATSEPILVTDQYDISLCCGDPGTQRSTPLDFTIPVETVGVLRIEFSAATDRLACSDIVLHILWDDVEIYSTERIGPVSGRLTTGSVDLGPLISRGSHTLTLSPEGVVGGCNTGALGGWAGQLIVHTSAFP